MKRFMAAICAAIFLSSCGAAKDAHETETPPPAVSATPEADVHQEPVATPTGEVPEEEDFPDAGTEFKLTGAQQALYDEYVKDYNFDISIFKGASPVDVAQVFIECGTSGMWEGEYNLYYFESQKVSKAQYEAEFQDDLSKRDIRTRRSFANLMFPNLNDGKFVDDGGGAGHIEFNSLSSDYVDVYEVTTKMNLMQIDGIWMVNQNRAFESA